MIKKIFLFIFCFFCTCLLLMAVQKPLFMLYHFDQAKDIPLMDYLRVIGNGAKLDVSVAGYLTVIPLLLSWVALWYDHPVLKRIMNLYLFLIALLLSALFCIDAELYTYWQFKLDATVFFYLQSPANAMASVTIGMFVKQIVLIAIGTAAIYFLLKHLVLPLFPAGEKSKLPYPVYGSIALILVGGVLFIAIRGGVTTSTANIGRVYFSQNQFLNHSAINPGFSLLASLSKSENFQEQFDFYPEEKRQELFSPLFPEKNTTPEDSVRLLNTSRPNILLILLESFSANAIESLGGTPDITPNLNRLSQEGVLFTQCYASSFRTDRGLVAALSGYPGQPTTSIMKIPAKSRTLPSIARSLDSAGYRSDVLYGGDINFTNMKGYFLSTGYSAVTADTDFPIHQRLSKWGAQDDVTFRYLYGELSARQQDDAPWMTTFLTLSTHEPFEVPYKRFEHPYLNTLAYADSCIGSFIDSLKCTSIWDDLLVVFVSDHGFRYPETLLDYSPERFHIPMLWIGGAVESPRRIDTIFSQTDLPAMLLGQMELPHDSYRFSRDILNGEYRHPFAFYTFNNGFSIIDDSGCSVYDNTGGRVIYQSPEAGSERRIEYGKAILQTLYDDLGNR